MPCATEAAAAEGAAVGEVKWDGYRLAVHIEPKGIRILTSGGHDWTDRFPAIAAAAKRLIEKN